MKIIDFEDIRGLNISPDICYQWVSEMIKDKERVILPPKNSLKPMEGVFCNVMPSILPRSDTWAGGVKVVTRYPHRQPSLDSKILLLNIENGEYLALMDATWITAMRTGAVAAHSIRNLAKSNYRTLSFIGLGNTARATMLILTTMEPDRVFHVRLLKYKGQEVLFAQRFKDYPNLVFSYVEDINELVKGADVIVSCATYIENDLCDDSSFDEGVLVVPVHTRGFTNCDLFFDKVFADDYGHVKGFKYFDRFRSFAEVSDVINGRRPGRENDKERILAYNIGVSMHDICFAAHIYQILQNDKARFDGLKDVNMRDAHSKFWV